MRSVRKLKLLSLAEVVKCICAPVDLRIFLCICAFLYLCICFVVCVPRTSYPPPDMEFVQKFKPPDFQATQVAGAWTERQKMFHGGSFLKLADDNMYIQNPEAQNREVSGF